MEAIGQTALALSVLLSAIIRALSLAQQKAIVEDGRARLSNLRQLTGISDAGVIQDRFGPSTLDGVWPHIRVEMIHAQSAPIGFVVGRQWTNSLGLVAGLFGLFIGGMFVSIVVFAATLQLVSWAFVWNLSET